MLEKALIFYVFIIRSKAFSFFIRSNLNYFLIKIHKNIWRWKNTIHYYLLVFLFLRTKYNFMIIYLSLEFDIKFFKKIIENTISIK